MSEENKEKIKNRIIRDIWKEKKKKEERNQRKRKNNKRIIKDKIIRDMRTPFEQEQDYYKPKRVSSFWNNNYIEYKSNTYQVNKNL